MKNSFVRIIFFLAVFSVFCGVCFAQSPSERELDGLFGNVKKVTQSAREIETWNYDCQGNLTEHHLTGFWNFDYIYSANGGSSNTFKYKSFSVVNSMVPPLYWNPVGVDGWQIYTLQRNLSYLFTKKAERNGFRLSEVAFAGADEPPADGGKRVWNKTFIYDKQNRLTELRTIDGNNLFAARILYTFDGDFPHPATAIDEFDYAARYRETYKYVLDNQKNWIEKEVVREQIENEEFKNQFKYKLKRKIDCFEPNECRQSTTR